MSLLPAVLEPREIAELETPQDAKDLYDTLEAYRRHYQDDHEKQNLIAEAKLRTARKGGELLAATVAQGGKSESNSRGGSSMPLPEGFTWSMSSRWQMLTWIPDDEWEATIAHAKVTSNDELTLDRMVRKGRELKLGGRAAHREKKAIAAAREHRCEHTLVISDIRAWRPIGVSSIITDPPYVGTVLPLYEALREFAVEVLPDGAPLVVMTHQTILPDVFEALRHPELGYRWTLCWRYASAENSTVDYARRVFDRWKPIVVFHKRQMPADATMASDEITSPNPDKRYHEWGQGLHGFKRLVGTFSQPGEIVCDPFLGGGTTAVAALARGRHFVGCDIDPEAVAVTEQRLAA